MTFVPPIVTPFVLDGPGCGWEGRVGMATLQSGAQAGDYVFFTGDSRAAQNASAIRVLGGFPVIHGGYPGIRIHDAINYIPAAISNAASKRVPKFIVLQIGINNAFLDQTCDEWSTMSVDYAMLCANIMTASPTSKLIVITPPSAEKGFAEPDSSVIERGQAAASISNIIKQWAFQQSVPCIDWNGQMRDSDLTLLPGSSIDGIHLSAAAWTVAANLTTPTLVYYTNH